MALGPNEELQGQHNRSCQFAKALLDMLASDPWLFERRIAQLLINSYHRQS